MKPHEQGWVLPMALFGLTVLSALATGAWHHAQQHSQRWGHQVQHERCHQLAHARMHAAVEALQNHTAIPEGVRVDIIHSIDLGWSAPHWRLNRMTANAEVGHARVVLQSTWAQALDNQGQVLSGLPLQRLSWREVWP